ncbi:MAG: hypothetical protein K8S98_15545 [Planctomycetes bacterium]|nr:hypothetical protein [Planctomycetota bacterium]
MLNGAGAPIESAVVWRLREAEFRRLGTTDALGVFVVDSNEITGCELLASHPRYQPTRQVVDDSGKAITLVLRAGATIRGSIVRAGGLPCAGVRVAGWVDGFEPECLALRDLHRDDPRCAQTVSDEAGRFELVGLDRARRYSVVAAGSGWVAERGAHRIAPDGEELTIQVAALYGVRVQFRDEDGALPRTAPEIWSSSGTAFDLLDERALQTVELSAARLLGLDFPCAEVERDDIALFYTRDDDAATVGPLVVRHRIPGYAPAMTRLDVPRVTGELATHVVRVRRDALDVGRLVVEFTGALAAEPELGNVVALGNYLELEGARGDKLRVRVAHASGSRALDGLPYGPYRARFFGADGLWRFPPDRGATVLEIGATPANFVVDWGDAAACIVRAFADDGAELDGPATLRVRSTTNRGIHQFEAARAPYVLVGLAPDEYDVAWLRPHEGAKYGQEAHRARLALTAGRVAEVRLDETR